MLYKNVKMFKTIVFCFITSVTKNNHHSFIKYTAGTLVSKAELIVPSIIRVSERTKMFRQYNFLETLFACNADWSHFT